MEKVNVSVNICLAGSQSCRLIDKQLYFYEDYYYFYLNLCCGKLVESLFLKEHYLATRVG